MLMAAVTSTSLSTETTSIRSAASDHTEGTGTSFVDSLAENTALPEERPSDVGGGHARTMSAVESDGPTPGKNVSTTIAAPDSEVRPVMNIAEKLHDGTENVKPSAWPGTQNTTVLVTNKTNSSVTGAALQHDGKPSEADADSQTTISDEQPVPVAPGTEGNQGQTLVHDGTDATERSAPQIATPVVAAGADGNVKQVIPGKNEILISGDGQNENSAGTVAKDHSASVKAEKGAKAEAKRDKKDKADMAASVAGVDTQATALVQVFVNSPGAQQSAAGDAEADVLASTSAVNSGRSAGAMATANGTNNRADANAVKSDDNSAKSTGPSSTDNPLSQKNETDATKPELGSAANPESEKSKPQSTVPSAADIGQLRVASGPASGVVSGNGLTHNAGVGSHTTETTSHAAATAQSGSNFIDTASADAAHTTLTATPTSLEVSVSNGTHGWLKIRAEMADGGAVNTSLSTSSTAGQEMLHRELPSLAAYLKSEHVAVNAVVVQPMAATGSDPRGSFAGASGSGHGQAQQSGSQGRENRQNPTPAHAGTNALYSSPGAMGEDEILSSTSYGQGGGWLSVRA